MRPLASQLAATLLAAALLFPSPAHAAPIGGACTDDNQCDAGSICNDRVCAALPKGRRIFPFYWHQPGDVGYRHIIPILWFSTWDRDGQVRVQVPFFVHIKKYADKSDTYAIPPLLTSWTKSPTETSVRVWPFFWYSSYAGGEKGPGTTSALLPLYWWSHVGKKRSLVLPLFGSGYSADDAQQTSFSMFAFLGYSWRNGDARTTLAPLTFVHHDDKGSAAVFFPLFWRTTNNDKGTTRTLLLPLFDYESSNWGKRKRLFSLFAAWEKNEDAGLEQLLIFVPPVLHRRDPYRDLDVAPPFFARWKVHEDGSSGFIAGNVYHSSDPEGSTTTVFPLYWGFHDRRSGAGTHIVVPFGGWHNGPGLKGFVFGPLYAWRNTNDAGSSGIGLAPLVLFHRAGTTHQELVLPIFARWGDDATRTSTTAVGPVFGRRTADGWDAGLLPIFFFGRHTDANYTYLLPLLFHRHSPESDTDVVGPAYFHRGRHGWSAGLAPLLFFGKLDGVEHQVVAPLFWRFADHNHDRESLLFANFYHHREGASSLDVLFPLVYLRRTPQRSTLITPLAYWKRDATHETLWAGPWFDQRDDRRHSRTRMLFPLWLQHDAPDYHVRVVFPLFWHVRDGSETDLALFPIYWRIRSPSMSLDGVFPLFVHSRTPEANTWLAGPLWVRTRIDGGRSLALAPLFAYRRRMVDGKAHSWAAGAGFYWSSNEETGDKNFIAGPLFDLRRHDGYTGGVVPLAFWWRRGTASHAIGPFVYWQRDAAADESLTVAGPVYWGHEGQVKRFGLVPFLFHKNDGDGTHTTLLLPLAYYEHRKLGSSLITPIFGYNKYPTGMRFYAGPFYFRRDEAQSSTALFPLAYFGRDKKTGSRVHFVLPLFLDTRGEDGRELQAYSPIVWRYHSVERTLTVGLPLYLDSNVFGESRLTWALPAVIRWDNRVANSTTYIVPPGLLWWRVRKGGDPGVDAVVFPIVWRFGGKDPTTVVAPFFWDFKRGESRTTVLFPVGARWTRPDGEHTLVLNTYYRKGIGPRAETWWLDIVPLVNFGRPRKHDFEWNVLEGLVGYSRQGINRTIRILWLLEFSLSPLPAQGVTFFGATPTSARTEF